MNVLLLIVFGAIIGTTQVPMHPQSEYQLSLSEELPGACKPLKDSKNPNFNKLGNIQFAKQEICGGSIFTEKERNPYIDFITQEIQHTSKKVAVIVHNAPKDKPFYISLKKDQEYFGLHNYILNTVSTYVLQNEENITLVRQKPDGDHTQIELTLNRVLDPEFLMQLDVIHHNSEASAL